MAKRPNFTTVNDVSDSTFKSVDQQQEARSQPVISLKRHPILFWVIIWVAIALPSAFAIDSLLNPNAVEPPTEPAIARNLGIKSSINTVPSIPPSPDSGQFPLWVFGAIAVGCTASCFVLARYIKPITLSTAEIGVKAGMEADFEAPIATLKPAFEPRSQPQINSSKQPLKRLKPYGLTEALPFTPLERSQPTPLLAAEWITTTPLDSPYTNEAAPVLATLILEEETQPLDWGEARLADAMDLRRRYPLHVAANNDSQS